MPLSVQLISIDESRFMRVKETPRCNISRAPLWPTHAAETLRSAYNGLHEQPLFHETGSSRIRKVRKWSNMLLIPTSQHAKLTLARLAADIVIIPSKEEAFGLTATEALSFGALPIISNAGGLIEIILPATSLDLRCIALRQATFSGIQVPYVDDVGELKMAFAFAIAEAVQLLRALRSCGLYENFLQRLVSSAQVKPSAYASPHSITSYTAYQNVLIAARTSLYPSQEGFARPKNFTKSLRW